MRELPIGVFDSGVGGLTVVKSMLDELPHESIVYFGDTAHVPYGSKTEQQLMSYARNILAYFMARHVKAVVVACGTHSSVTLPHIHNDYEFPLLGVLKAGARSAVKITANRRIGVAATYASVKSGAYTREIKALQPDAQVFEVACPRFVPLVESGQLDGAETQDAVREYIGPLVEQGIDTLILGCTHYPFLSPVIKEYVGAQATLIDPSQATIEELKVVLDGQQLLRKSSTVPEREFLVSGNNESFFTVGKLLIGNVIQRVDQIFIEE